MIENGYDEIVKLTGNSTKIYYSKGYNITEEIIKNDTYLIKEATRVAKISDLVILFLGTPESYDEEDHDRENIDLPANQVELLKEIAKVQKNIIVILSNGSPVTISPWYKYATSILEAWLTGQGSGGAIADVLFGIVNPSGKLPSTFPIQLSDNPTYLDYVDSENNLEYKEGIFVGYRYYDKKNMEVEFPFGFGLSYTTFCYSDLTLSKDVLKDNYTLEVNLKIKNTGVYFGKEVVQLYVGNSLGNVPRPIKELKTFTKVSLHPGEEKKVRFRLHKRDFSYYDVMIKDWVVKSGTFQILVGKSSRDICLMENISVQSPYIPKIKYTRDTFIGDFLLHPNAKTFVESLLKDAAQSITTDEKAQKQIIGYLKNIPISKLLVINKGSFTKGMLDELLELVT
ncbi:Thermostable beta-glucosidase B [Clostridium vincentii]|uniref:Thermostable beta-glucosidase B n=1 Tax=Clostridium vincentii TaxID=52704 RepID=A0A2T0BIJ7_9CLOT|nr:Thermostable beta-glucosidase B [Clostridium vincentii]